MSRLAGFIVTRLNSNRQNYWHLGVKPREEIKTLALGIRRLPAAHLLPHKEAMIAVASRPDVQLYGYFALQRLAVFGDDAVPTLLQLMKTGLAGGDKFFRKNQFQHPYIAGLIGLCEAGPSATSALADLRKMQDQGVLPTHASYGRLLFKTLIRLGENKEHVRELFKASARNEAYATDERFQRLVVRANRKNPDCYY